MDTTNIDNRFQDEQDESELSEQKRNDEEDRDLDKKTPVTSFIEEPATEKQHKFLAFLCYKKGMTPIQKNKLEESFIKKFKLWRFSDIDKSQISAVIDFVNRYWNKEGKYNELVKSLFLK